MRTCENCGTPQLWSAMVCTNCGHNLDKRESPYDAVTTAVLLGIGLDIVYFIGAYMIAVQGAHAANPKAELLVLFISVLVVTAAICFRKATPAWRLAFILTVVLPITAFAGCIGLTMMG